MAEETDSLPYISTVTQTRGQACNLRFFIAFGLELQFARLTLIGFIDRAAALQETFVPLAQPLRDIHRPSTTIQLESALVAPCD